MDCNRIDWTALERLRANFLEGAAAPPDYWQSERDLESYDQTFGRRIGWKWGRVLDELSDRGWRPPEGDFFDWGCGSGVAGRAALECFGAGAGARLILWDRSRLAMKYAAARARQAFPAPAVECHDLGGTAPGTLLLSHIVTELSPQQLDDLLARAAEAAAILWVEPGTFQASRALIAARERLRGAFQIVAPCTHQPACGMLATGNERYWCHHFAPSPAEAHTDAGWARFGRLAGIDLRSLPLSYLVLDKRPAPALPAGAVRIIGRPRVEKAFARVLGCDETGVREKRLAKRALAEEYRRMKRGDFSPLQAWRCEGDAIVAAEPVWPARV